jgi:hypothetical protein
MARRQGAQSSAKSGTHSAAAAPLLTLFPLLNNNEEEEELLLERLCCAEEVGTIVGHSRRRAASWRLAGFIVICCFQSIKVLLMFNFFVTKLKVKNIKKRKKIIFFH